MYLQEGIFDMTGLIDAIAGVEGADSSSWGGDRQDRY